VEGSCVIKISNLPKMCPRKRYLHFRDLDFKQNNEIINYHFAKISMSERSSVVKISNFILEDNIPRDSLRIFSLRLYKCSHLIACFISVEIAWNYVFVSLAQFRQLQDLRASKLNLEREKKNLISYLSASFQSSEFVPQISAL